MDTIIYEGERKVAVEAVEEPQIQRPNGVAIDVTTTCICGSDLHMYKGRAAAEPGVILGHENMGIVEEVGDAVSSLEVGDHVVVPFNIVCGFCENCENDYTGFYTDVNPGLARGAYDYVTVGPYQGGQAEKLRIPYADSNALKLPDGWECEDLFALLADILPTGWHGTKLANLGSSDSVAIYGAGPVGLMTAYSIKLKGAAEICVVDRVPSRLALAEEHCDATPISFKEGGPIEQVKKIHGGGVDKGVDAVSYQTIDSEREADFAYDPARENPTIVINNLIRAVRPTGKLGTPGLYVPDDPDMPDEVAAQGRLGIDFSLLFEKRQALDTGQCNVKEYNRQLRDMIIEGRADPSWVVSHRVGLKDAPEMYEEFDNRGEGVTKVLLKPWN